jgi:aldehyde:ferredoxin oxidoreductase
MTNIKIAITTTRNYGNQSHSITLETTLESPTQEQRIAMFANLRAVTDAEFARFETNHLQHGITDTKTTTRTVTGGSIEKRYHEKTGKVMYRWVVAPFVKYGVPVYEDALPSIILQDLTQGGSEQFDMSGWSGKVEMVDGKPKRVTGIAKS